MTQPIQEPLTQRAISALTWDKNQLYRRPDVSQVGGTLPWCRVSKPFPDGTFYPNQTILNNTNATIDFDLVYNIGTGESGEAYFNTQGSPVNTIRVINQGVIAITAEVIWSETENFPWYMSFSGDGFNWAHRAHFGYWYTTASDQAMGSTTFIHRYEDTSNSDIELHVYQRSGGSRTIEAAYLETVHLGGYTGIDFDDILPFQ